MILRFLTWILRLFAWPWTVRICERWAGAPQVITPATNELANDAEPRVDGTRMDDDTANTYRDSRVRSAIHRRRIDR